jgi:phage-related protein
MGNALGIAQFGGTHPDVKAWKGEGPGVFEIVERHDGNAYRSIYTVRFRNAVYVLHAFRKKSPKGVKTARGDIELVHQRVMAAKKDYEEYHGKAE